MTAPLLPEPSFSVPEGRVEARTGAVRSRFGLSAAAALPGRAEDMAASFLRAAAPDLGLAPEARDLEPVRSRRGLGTRHVVFRQVFRGVPVWGSEVVVSLHGERQVVTAVASEYKPGVVVASVEPLITAQEAARSAVDHVRAAGGAGPRREDAALADAGPFTELVVHSHDGVHRLAWRVTAVLSEPLGDWEVFVDARAGGAFSVSDRMCYLNGSGLAFDPDPISCAQVPYGTPGYIDDDDANSPELENIRVHMPLHGITQLLDQYLLAGPYTVIQDSPGNLGLPLGDDVLAYAQLDPHGFNYTRDEQGFEAVMVYGHITNLQLWIQALGFTDVNNDQDPADPHGHDGADQASYSVTLDALQFGEGGVDGAEDAGVIAHEYGHAIQHDQVPGWGRFIEGSSMGEGFSDYLAGSYVKRLSDYQSNWVCHWDGPPGEPGQPGLRRLDSPKLYPADLTYFPHNDGEIWSACLWQIHQVLGRRATDTIVLQSHFYLTPGATFRDGALALLQADRDVNGGANEAMIRGVFEARGILSPTPFLVAGGTANQKVASVGYDRLPDSRLGRFLITAWDNLGTGSTSMQRVHASGVLEDPTLTLAGLANVDVGFAPRQKETLQDFLVVGEAGLGDVYGAWVDSKTNRATPLFPISAEPPFTTESQAAVAAVGHRHLVAYIYAPPAGGSWVQLQVIADSALSGAPTLLVGPTARAEPAVAGGWNPATGLGQFLVAWMEHIGPPFAEYSIRAQRVSLDGTPLGGEIGIAGGTGGDLWHHTPAVAFDGAGSYLVVWTRVSAVAGTRQIWGRFVNAATGAAGAPFTIDPGPNQTYPDVAFASSQFLVVWYTELSLAPGLGDVMGRRLKPGPVFVDAAAFPIAAKPSIRERWPSVTHTGGDTVRTLGGGFYVAWSEGPSSGPSDYDVWATFVPEVLTPIAAPAPLRLGVSVVAPPDTIVEPGGSVTLLFTVQNMGDLRDGYRLTPAWSQPWQAAVSRGAVVLDPGGTEVVGIELSVPASAARGDSDVVSLVAVSVLDPAVSGVDAVVVRVDTTQTTGVRPPGGPLAFRLLPNAPNPFSTATRIRFALDRPSEVRVEVLDLTGRTIRTLSLGPRGPGAHSVGWDGSDGSGRRVPSGLYFCRVSVGTQSREGKILVVR